MHRPSLRPGDRQLIDYRPGTEIRPQRHARRPDIANPGPFGMGRKWPAVAAYDLIRICAGWDVHHLRIGEDLAERNDTAIVLPALVLVNRYPVTAGDVAIGPP